jgi:UDP-N-acetylmuramate dehydrogenase
MKLTEQLADILGRDHVRVDEDMRAHTSFKAGGRADLFLTPRDADSLIEALRLLSDAGVRRFLLGNGTNVLVRDGGYRGAIVRIGGMAAGAPAIVAGSTEDSAPGDGGTRILVAGAGESLSAVARFAAERGLSGLEAISGIPGSVGGALFMNAGAYGAEMADVTAAADVYDAVNDKVVTVKASDMRLSYRDSVFRETHGVILSVTLRLRSGGDRATIVRAIEAYARRRNEKQPMELPSAGSFFKRPEGDYAGRLIEAAGLKGFSVGGAKISEKHAGFLVNAGGAAAKDILALADEAQRRVRDLSGVLLEPEPRIIGEE